MFLPEGWAFFTRNPREETVEIWKIDPNRKLKKISCSHGSPANLFGLIKSQRIIYNELGQGISTLESKGWLESRTGDIYEKLNETKLDTIKLNSNILEGEYLITATKPKPYVWRNLENFKMPIKSRRIYVKKTI